jgi:hypothetical protein
MAIKKIETPQEIYQIKIALLGTRPPIWRRLLVPAGMTLEQLHDVLQMAMGWEDCHMHDFRIGKKQFGKPELDDSLMGMPATVDESTVRVFNVLGKVGAKAVYTYDFGDGWEHSVAVEKVLAPDPGFAYPVCTGGKLNGPPEDCGGVAGYYNLLEAIRNPDHEEHEEMQEWVGDDFDPDAFSMDEVNERLTPIQRCMAKS